MTLLVAAILVITATAVAVGALLLIRHFSPHGGHFGDTSRAAGVFSILATSFAVLFAFMIFLAFTAYDKSRTGAETEASTVVQQFETAQLLPPEQGNVLSGELVCYARSVVYQEWPQMEQGRPPSVNPWGAPMFLTFKQINPTTPAQQAAYSKWLDQTTTRELARQDRVHTSTGVIPSPLWFVLLVSAGVVLAFVFFFADRGERAMIQAMQVGAVMAMLAASLLVIRFLDQPYSRGAGSIRPTAMEQSLSQLDFATKALNLPLTPPCDDQGRALAASPAN